MGKIQNSHTLKITGVSELPSPLEIGKSYELRITGDCNAIKKQNNDDGSFTFTYSVKQLTGELVADKGDVIKFTDRKSQSQKFRQQLVFIAQERGVDAEEFYEQTMTKFRHYTMQILDFISSLEK